jgi:uncharacterized protein YcnI
VIAFASSAAAHVELSERGQAGQRQVLDFTVGHGCEGADTVGVEIRIPEGITSVRAIPWEFGEAEVVTDDAGLPIAVRWTKSSTRPVDDQFYTVAIRVTVPDMPFTTLYFPAIQTCRTAEGAETVVEWIGLPGDAEEPAPGLLILPRRYPGWNKISVPASVPDLSVFDDAEIVWQGSAAYSSNPAIMELIAAEPGVEVLTELTTGTDVWVRY